jgi:hypothetical protein
LFFFCKSKHRLVSDASIQVKRTEANKAKQVFVMAHTALLMESLELGFGVQLTPGTQAGILEAAKV